MKGCWRQLKVPAEAAVFCRAPAGYVCSDRVAYQVTGENGQIAAYDVTMPVKETRWPRASSAAALSGEPPKQ